MGTTLRGIVKDAGVIEVEGALPYPAGTELSLQVEPVEAEPHPPTEDAVRRFWALVGAGRSGLTDVSERKHDYLAEAYREDHQAP